MKKLIDSLFGSPKKGADDLCDSDNPESDCSKVLSVLQLIIDDEATEDDQKFFKKHVNECEPCLEHYQVEKSLLEEIKAKIEKKECPEEIVKSIKEKLKEASTEE